MVGWERTLSVALKLSFDPLRSVVQRAVLHRVSPAIRIRWGDGACRETPASGDFGGPKTAGRLIGHRLQEIAC